MRFLLTTICSFSFLFGTALLACEVDVKTDKDSYKIGDTAIIKATITQQHKNCRKDSIEPTIKASESEIEIIGKTKFKKVDGNSDVWSISYKAKIKVKNPYIVELYKVHETTNNVIYLIFN